MPEFFRVVAPAQVFHDLAAFPRLGTEQVKIEDALFRYSSQEIISREHLPPLPRATMDGYAVQAADTFGASESLPCLLRKAGRVDMGILPRFGIASGDAAEIPTGGFLPQGADAVVMVEYTRQADESTIEVFKPVTTGENVLGEGSDVRKGEVLIASYHRFRPQDIGLLAGLGISKVWVFRRPQVAVMSSGNEIVPLHTVPEPGQVRDINTYSVSSLVRAAGAEALIYGIVSDDHAALRDTLQRAVKEADVVVVSGGSSVGERDLMADAVASLPGARVLVHGVAVTPGKPTLLARVNDKALFGLPGHPVSAMTIAQIFLVPFLAYLGGGSLQMLASARVVEAVLSTSVPSVQGREEYVRVKIEDQDGVRYARPVFGKSGMLSTMVKSDGVIVIPIHAEGLSSGEKVEVILF